MKKINLLDILGLTDNEMINRAIETDSAEKLKEIKILEKRKKYSGIFRFTSIFAGGIAVFVIGIFLFNNNINDNTLIPNPMTKVESINELEKYIEIDLSKFKFKEIKEMYKFEDDALIQITYKDDSTIRISKGQEDNSGIHGATLKETKKINDTNVEIYKFNDTIYAVWKNEKNSYVFSYVASDNEDINSILLKIV